MYGAVDGYQTINLCVFSSFYLSINFLAHARAHAVDYLNIPPIS